MNNKRVEKKVIQYALKNKITIPVNQNLIVLATLFNLAKGNITNPKEINKFIQMMDLKPFTYLHKEDYSTPKEMMAAINLYAEQFAYPKSVRNILIAYLDAYIAHQKVNKFEYFYKMDHLDEAKQKVNVDLLSNFLDKSRQLNDTIIDSLKYNYSSVIEYARDSIKKD